MIYTQSESQIVFSSNIEKEVAEIINSCKSKVFVLTDSNTIRYCYPLIEKSMTGKADIFTMPAGEEQKNIESVVKVWDFLNSNGADRKSLLINLGGGVLCDLGGFAASTFKRGIDFIQIPTTLLAQIDASVGEKQGLILKNIKMKLAAFLFQKK